MDAKRTMLILHAQCLRHVLECYEDWLREHSHQRPLTLKEYIEEVYTPVQTAALAQAKI